MNRFDEILYQEKMGNLQKERQFIAVSKLGAKLTLDGNSYCWLVGKNIQSGVAGFGKSAYEAMIDFNNNFAKRLVSDG